MGDIWMIYIYIYMCVCICIYIYVYVYVYMYIYMYMCVCMMDDIWMIDHSKAIIGPTSRPVGSSGLFRYVDGIHDSLHSLHE